MVMNDAVINNAGDDTALARVWIIHTKVRNFHLVSSSFLPHRNRMTRCVVPNHVWWKYLVISWENREFWTLFEDEQTTAVWCLSGQFTSPFPLIGRLVNWTDTSHSWERGVRCDICFTPEMWSLTCLSKPNTLDLNKTLGSWSSSSVMICVSQVCDIVGGEMVPCFHHDHNKTQRELQ